MLRPGTTQSILNGNGSSATNPVQDLYIICTGGMLSCFHVSNGFNLIQMVALVGWQHMFHNLIPVKDFDPYGLSHILSVSNLSRQKKANPTGYQWISNIIQVS